LLLADIKHYVSSFSRFTMCQVSITIFNRLLYVLADLIRQQQPAFPHSAGTSIGSKIAFDSGSFSMRSRVVTKEIEFHHCHCTAGLYVNTRTDVKLMCFWIEVCGWTPTVYIMTIFSWAGRTVRPTEK
jgi:hypothetical protein